MAARVAPEPQEEEEIDKLVDGAAAVSRKVLPANAATGVAATQSGGTGPTTVSSGGSSSYRSGSLTSVSLTGARLRALDCVQFVCFQTQQRRELWVNKLAVLALVVELLQFATFCVDDRLFRCGSGAQHDALRAVRHLRDVVASCGASDAGASVALGCFGGFLILLWASFTWQIVLVLRGALGLRKIFVVTKVLSLLMPPLFFPACYAFLHPYAALRGDTVSGDPHPASLAVGGGCFLWYLGIYLVLSVFCNDFRPRDSWLSMSHPRCRLILAVTRAVLLIADVFFANIRETWSALLYTTVTVCVFGLLAALHLIFMPYYRKGVNMCVLGVLVGALLAMPVSYVGYFYHGRVPLAVIAFAVLAIASSSGFLFYQLRMCKAVTLGTIPTPGSSARPTFRFPFQCDLAAKRIYTMRSRTQAAIDEGEAIFEEGLRLFPTSAYLLLMYAQYLKTIKNDSQAFHGLASKVKQMRPFYDVQYIIYCVTVNGGNEVDLDTEANLMVAMRHHKSAMACSITFWHQLMKTRNSVKTDAILGMVGQIAKHELAAESLYKKALADNEHSPRLLRQYAIFLREVKDDREQAEVLCQLADDFEEQQSRTHTKEDKGELRFNVTSRGQPLPLNDNVSAYPLKNTVIGGKELRPSFDESQSAQSYGTGTESDRNSHFSSVSEGGTNITEERSRVLQYRQHVDQSRVWPVLRLRIGLYCSLIALLCGVFVLYGVIMAATKETMTGYKSVSYSSEVAQSLLDSTFCLRQLQHYANNSLYPREGVLGVLADSENALRKEVQAAMGIAVSQEERNTWEGHNIISIYIPETNLWEQTNMSLFDSYTRAMAAVQALQAVFNGTESTDLNFDPDLRFLLDNTVQTILSKTLELSFMQGDENDNTLDRTTLTIEIILPIWIVASLAVFAFAVLPSDWALVRERKAVAALFLDVPKSTCANIAEHLEENLGDHKKVIFRGKKFSTLKRVRVLTLCILSLVVALAGGMCAMQIGYMAGHSENDHPYTYFEEAETNAMLLAHLAFDLPLNDSMTWAPNELFERYSAAEAVLQYDLEKVLFKFGNAYETDEDDDDWMMLYWKSCPEALKQQYNITCTGLKNLLDFYQSNLHIFFRLPASSQTLNSPYLLKPLAVLPTLRAWMGLMSDDLLEEAKSVLSTVELAVSLFLAMSVPAVVLYFVATYPMIRTLKEEYASAQKLLLLVPANVLRSTESIREYFESGASTAQASIKGANEEQEKRTKLILDGSKDAVIVANDKLIIEIFNPSAERLFGLRADEVLGLAASVVLPDTLIEVLKERATHRAARRSAVAPAPGSEMEDDNEAVVRRKSGELITVLFSTTEIVTAKGVTIAMFMKDIRKLKAQEAALEAHKQQADALLLNILPKTVKEQLEAHPGQLLAQKYKQVTIAFADIVEFTPMASRMTPHELVSMLNQLFCMWDVMLGHFNVEKVKTIGDCYMVAGGMPTPNSTHAADVLEFCIAMFITLGQFNETTNRSLQIRIGINTGPAVAGVIGKSKWAFDLWGDAVNLASRLESSGVPGRIQISESARDLLSVQGYEFESRGNVVIKGKGEVECFLLKEPKALQAKRQLPEIQVIADEVETPSFHQTLPPTMSVESFKSMMSLPVIYPGDL
eukprot:TRINITY_DN3303_c0_g1_i3.p1 TRINITY_DN3303_c0_g1~~TRINITY_DN3303_c0_g1_i3.p1  ORF type:complete len:1625 (-),score=379.64 TRINITY_DN3303_c0_g1_i3:66-4940(-)